MINKIRLIERLKIERVTRFLTAFCNTNGGSKPCPMQAGATPGTGNQEL